MDRRKMFEVVASYFVFYSIIDKVTKINDNISQYCHEIIISKLV